MGKKIKNDIEGQIQYLIPLIGLILLFAGLYYLTQMSWSVGLVITGLGLLILGIGGRGTLYYNGIKLIAPVGALLMVVGIILSFFPM